MTFLTVGLTILAALLTGAHFLRWGEWALVLLSVGAPLLLLVRRRWTLRLLQALGLGAAGMWLLATVDLVRLRMALGRDWARLAAILGAVTLVVLAATWLLGRLRDRYPDPHGSARTSVGASLLALALLLPPHLVVDTEMILLERFLPGGGWLEIAALTLYAGWLAGRMVTDPATWRGRLWTLFSVVFFAQLALGLAGFERFLLSGELHLPVPAVILGGPLYRGEGLFMPVLFASTIFFVGPAWCSHLCYVGAWDHHAAVRGPKRPEPLPGWRPWARVLTLVGVVGVALGLSWLGAPGPLATGLGLAFGLLGVAMMLTWSRRTGAMTHCTAWCPLGLLATKLGWLNPFRVRLLPDACTSCMACTRACRFDALHPAHIEAGRIGEACTLCGDCLPRCKHGALEYRWLWLRGEPARKLFLTLVVGFHAAGVGLAML